MQVHKQRMPAGASSASAPRCQCIVAGTRPRRALVTKVFAKLRPASEPHLQLGTAKLPSAVDVPRFADYMYQWAATMTQSGSNFPFILPIKTDKYPEGFKISLLKKSPAGNFDSAGEIQGTVEEVPGKGNVVMIRFFEGPAGLSDRRTPPPANPDERLNMVLQSLVDVDTIMSTMPLALRKGVAACTN